MRRGQALQPESELTGDDQASTIRLVYEGRLFPIDQARAFRSSERAFATRAIRRGPYAQPLPRSPLPLRDLRICSRDQEFDVFDYVSRNRVAALIVLKNGRVGFEHYEAGYDAATRWMSMSMAKSISSALVGAAIQDGLIGSIKDPIDRYVPQLAGTGYEGVSIQHILQMSSGVRWDDTHTDPASERRQMLELQISQQPGAILDYIATLPRVAEPGAMWNYSTGETHIVGALLRAATGRWLADYLSEKIWSPCGMESDATWWLESAQGLEVAGSGVSATLRDYARVGLFMMNDGVVDGREILAPGWARDSGASRLIGGKRVDYGYMWWAVPDATGSLADGAFSARGIFGQFIYINPRAQIVIAVLSARSKPKNAEAILDNDFFNAVVRALR
jgi:CubicO group peptidase (beta-lactamase class C family)